MTKVGRFMGFVGIVVWGMSSLAHATVMNGAFSAGLTGWTTTDMDTNGNMVSPSASITEQGGQAVLKTQGIASNIVLISLSQDIDIPTLATNLSFDIGLARDTTMADTPPAGFSFPDFVQASYVDATDTIFDRTFVSLGVNDVFRFTTPITTLAGRSGILFFDLSDQDDGFFSTARIDDVLIDVGTTAVPEPGTWLLLGSGLLGLRVLVGKRGRRMRRRDLTRRSLRLDLPTRFPNSH